MTRSSLRRTTTLLAAILLIGLTTACDTDDTDDSTPDDSATWEIPAEPADPCSLLTADEIGAAFAGFAFGPGKEDYREEESAPRRCEFERLDPLAVLWVSTELMPEGFEGLRQRFVDQADDVDSPQEVTPVDDLGDGGYLFFIEIPDGPRFRGLVVNRGPHALMLVSFGVGGERATQGLRELMTIALDRL